MAYTQRIQMTHQAEGYTLDAYVQPGTDLTQPFEATADGTTFVVATPTNWTISLPEDAAVLCRMSREGTTEWHFFVSYVAAALWSSTGDDGEPLDADHDRDDLAPSTAEAMLYDCVAFYVANSEHIHCDDAPLARDFEGSIAAREAAMAGHDFWLTRCGAGVGFWDGDWPEPHATALEQAAKAFGNMDLYAGDDGLIYYA